MHPLIASARIWQDQAPAAVGWCHFGAW